MAQYGVAVGHESARDVARAALAAGVSVNQRDQRDRLIDLERNLQRDIEQRAVDAAGKKPGARADVWGGLVAVETWARSASTGEQPDAIGVGALLARRRRPIINLSRERAADAQFRRFRCDGGAVAGAQGKRDNGQEATDHWTLATS